MFHTLMGHPVKIFLIIIIIIVPVSDFRLLLSSLQLTRKDPPPHLLSVKNRNFHNVLNEQSFKVIQVTDSKHPRTHIDLMINTLLRVLSS